MLQPDTSLWIWGTFLPANCPLGLINDFWIAVGIWWTISGWRTATKTWTQITNCRIFQLKKNQKETGANYLSLKTKKNVLYSVLGGLWEAGDTGQSPVADLLTNTNKRGKCCSLFEIMKLPMPQNFFFHLKQGLYGVLGSILTFLVSVPLFHFLPVLICFSHLVGIFLLLAARWFHRVFVNRSHEIFPLLFQSKLTDVPGDSSVGIHIK